MTDTEQPSKRPRIMEHVPNWIAALAALITAVVAAASFFAGRATAPSRSPDANPLAPFPSTASAPAATTPAASAGTPLSSFTVDLPGQYGLLFGATPSRPIATEDGIAPHLGTSFCYLGHDVVVSVTLKASQPQYQTLAIVVWAD